MKAVLWGLLILSALVLSSLLLAPSRSEFSGADGQAEKVISALHPEYKPWFSALWQPPSTEIESLLFSLQAALGSGALCYYLGYARGRESGRKRGEASHAAD